MKDYAENETITAIDGIRVAHATDTNARTGCTVILCEPGAVAGVDVRGSAPGTRETDAIRPGNLVEKAHAVLLTGGSAFGLDAVGGVMRFLEERRIGFPAGPARVPIVPAAVIFDLGVGDASAYPNKEMGYRACKNATSDSVKMGQIGAGAGATVGKLPGYTASNGGVGSACCVLHSGLFVAAIVVVNALGNIVHPTTGVVVAGAKDKDTGEYVDIVAHLCAKDNGGWDTSKIAGTNTTVGVVATNAALSSTEAAKVAQMAHDGLARVIRPAHTMFDGDTIFALSLGSQEADVNTVGILGVEAVAESILRAVQSECN